MKPSTILSYLFLFLLFSACQKDVSYHSDDIITEHAHYFLVNPFDQEVSIYIVDSMDNRELKMTVATGDTAELPIGFVKKSSGFFYTWHTKDYKTSNWYLYASEEILTSSNNTTEFGSRYIVGKQNNKEYVVLAAPSRNELLYCFSDYGKDTRWQAVDAYDATGASVWNTLALGDRKQDLRITKYRWLYLNNDTGYFRLRGKSATDCTLFSVSPKTQIVLSNTFAPQVPLVSASFDVMYMYNTEKKVYYKMQRQ